MWNVDLLVFLCCRSAYMLMTLWMCIWLLFDDDNNNGARLTCFLQFSV